MFKLFMRIFHVFPTEDKAYFVELTKNLFGDLHNENVVIREN